jgi:hypothetical protein
MAVRKASSAGAGFAGSRFKKISPRTRIVCKIWYSISQTVSDLGNVYDRSIRAFAVKPRAFGAPLCGFGA